MHARGKLRNSVGTAAARAEGQCQCQWGAPPVGTASVTHSRVTSLLSVGSVSGPLHHDSSSTNYRQCLHTSTAVTNSNKHRLADFVNSISSPTSGVLSR